VLTATFFFSFSLLFGTYKGLLAKWILRFKAHRRLYMQQLLRSMFDVLEAKHDGSFFAVCDLTGSCTACSMDPEQVYHRRSWSRSKFNRVLHKGARLGWLRFLEKGQIVFTAKGMEKAREHARQHRLWELYLIQYADIAPSHVHHDVERIEEVAPPEVVQEIETIFDSEVMQLAMPAEPHPH